MRILLLRRHDLPYSTCDVSQGGPRRYIPRKNYDFVAPWRRVPARLRDAREIRAASITLTTAIYVLHQPQGDIRDSGVTVFEFCHILHFPSLIRRYRTAVVTLAKRPPAAFWRRGPHITLLVAAYSNSLAASCTMSRATREHWVQPVLNIRVIFFFGFTSQEPTPLSSRRIDGVFGLVLERETVAPWSASPASINS